jgi:hypothetical protein
MPQTVGTLLLLAAAALTTIGATRSGQGKTSPSFAGVLDEHPAIQYGTRATRDRVDRLQSAVADGTVHLAHDQRSGYLRSVLDALDVSVESQLLVFSKTGVQRAATHPQNPRALYFDDSVVVGYIPGARYLELASHDPEQGVVFYTIDQADPSGPDVTRRTNCLSCHVSASTAEVPGLINRSVFARADGSVIAQLGSNDVDHRTPLLQRWGGMYVSGNYLVTPYSGRKEHNGNLTITSDPPDASSTSNEVRVQWMNSSPETRGYPSAESDIASMMLFDHQAHAINLLTRLNWESRVEGSWRDIAHELADYFLFVDEAPPPARLAPRPGFAAHFSGAGPRDRQGRSLRELDLETRLLRYPCSYMIQTEAFANLPARAKDAVYQRLWSVLSGRDSAAKYSHLTASDRRAIVEILRDTKSDLPAIFRERTF